MRTPAAAASTVITLTCDVANLRRSKDDLSHLHVTHNVNIKITHPRKTNGLLTAFLQAAPLQSPLLMPVRAHASTCRRRQT